MTYANVVKRGWFCECSLRTSQRKTVDSWKEWLLCNQCRLPIKGSNRHPQHAGLSEKPQR